MSLPTKQQLIDNLPEFYSEYGYDEGFVSLLFELMLGAAEMIENYILQVKSTLIVNQTEAYRFYDFYSIIPNGALYELNTVLSSESLLRKVGASLSYADRLLAWEVMDDSDKISILESLGLYVELVARRDIDSFDPSIEGADVFDSYGTLLSDRSDYLISGNKLFLLGAVAMPSSRNEKIILRDIAVDYKTAERKLGDGLDIDYLDELTKPEYRDFVVMASYAALGGPTLKNIKSAFTSLSGWEDVSIFDKYSASDHQKILWSSGGELTDFEFIVSIPTTAPIDEDRMTVFKQFLDTIKPSHTSYVISFNPGRPVESIIYGQNLIENLAMGIDMALDDEMTVSETVITRTIQSEPIVEAFTQVKTAEVSWDTTDASAIFDSGLYYDTGIQALAVAWDDTIIWDDENVFCPSDGYADIVSVKLIDYPEYPLVFSAVKNIGTGNVNISFKDNAEYITRYEILRNDIIVSTLTGSGGDSILSYTDTTFAALGSGTYRYCARSVYEPDPGNPSLTKYSSKSLISTIVK